MVDDKQLSPAEMDRYREVYCGVCHSLRDQNGQLCRLALTYDMTFLALLLDSLYEPAETASSARCGAHPKKPQAYATSECTEYAADATVILAYHKLLDDWNDEGKVSRRAAAGIIHSAYREASARRPRMAAAVEAGMAEIRGIEGVNDASLDAAANRFGALLGEVFAYRDDFWADELRRLGAFLGKFVYLMDAVMDFEDDAKTGSYNPLIAAGCEPSDMDEALRMIAAQAAQTFERLPLVQDVHILRNSLYAGMWGQYCGKFGMPGADKASDGRGEADAECAGPSADTQVGKPACDDDGE